MAAPSLPAGTATVSLTTVRARMPAAGPRDVPITFADISKARARLGYAPTVGIDEGIARFVAWFRREGVR